MSAATELYKPSKKPYNPFHHKENDMKGRLIAKDFCENYLGLRCTSDLLVETFEKHDLTFADPADSSSEFKVECECRRKNWDILWNGGFKDLHVPGRKGEALYNLFITRSPDKEQIIVVHSHDILAATKENVDTEYTHDEEMVCMEHVKCHRFEKVAGVWIARGTIGEVYV